MTWVYDGQKVLFIYTKNLYPAPAEHRWLLCEVKAAMGTTARVVNEMHNVDTWADVHELEPLPDVLRGEVVKFGVPQQYGRLNHLDS
jgi:hypothetical protein